MIIKPIMDLRREAISAEQEFDMEDNFQKLLRIKEVYFYLV